MSRDSAFALGTAIKHLKYPNDVSNFEYNDRIYETLLFLKEAEYLPVSTIAVLLGCSRSIAQKMMAKMWKARLVKCIETVTYSTPNMAFKLWINSTSGLPKNASESCRLAVLGAFYGRIKKEQFKLEWNLLKSTRSKTRKYLCAEMIYQPVEKKEPTALLIDAPRRGDKPNPDADIYIFPTMEEAKVFTPKGKRFTTDIILMNKNINFTNLVSDPVE